MKIIGILCEYNPFHAGHKRQFDVLRAAGECGIVCLMSGHFVQRGEPAVFDKSLRAKAALESGADLVLELPVNAALSSAEGFAAGGVRILSGFCDALCFGTETGTRETLTSTAEALLSPAFPDALRAALESGCSFPAARQTALEAMGRDASLLRSPNDILAVEYCKAILSQGSSMEPLPIPRPGGYHDILPDAENPSATALRLLLSEGRDIRPYVPEAVRALCGAPVHTLAAGERAVLGRLRTITEAEFEALPYGSEGLWRKFLHACRSEATLEDILTAVKSKRYTRTRLNRMVMCAFLGLRREDLAAPAPYTRVLGFNDTGRAILKQARLRGSFPNAGEAMEDPFWQLEQRCGDLYGLFRADAPASAGQEPKRRVIAVPGNHFSREE